MPGSSKASKFQYSIVSTSLIEYSEKHTVYSVFLQSLRFV